MVTLGTCRMFFLFMSIFFFLSVHLQTTYEALLIQMAMYSYWEHNVCLEMKNKLVSYFSAGWKWSSDI